MNREEDEEDEEEEDEEAGLKRHHHQVRSFPVSVTVVSLLSCPRSAFPAHALYGLTVDVLIVQRKQGKTNHVVSTLEQGQGQDQQQGQGQQVCMFLGGGCKTLERQCHKCKCLRSIFRSEQVLCNATAAAGEPVTHTAAPRLRWLNPPGATRVSKFLDSSIRTERIM